MRKHKGNSVPNYRVVGSSKEALYGSRPTACQIVKMATGIQLNLNTACVTADKYEVFSNCIELMLFPFEPYTARLSSIVELG